MGNEIELEPNTSTGNYRFGQSFDEKKWFKAVILKAKLHVKEEDGEKKRSIRVRMGVDATYTEPATGVSDVSCVMLDHFVGLSKKAQPMRSEFFRAIGYGDVDKAGGKLNLDEWYGCECMVKLKMEMWQDRPSAKISDLKAITPGTRTRRDMPPPPKDEDDEALSKEQPVEDKPVVEEEIPF